jgi:hypothetical protein
MGFFRPMFRLAKEMDKEREKEMRRKLKHQMKLERLAQQKKQASLLQLVDEHLSGIVTIQKEWANSYNFKRKALDYLEEDGVEINEVGTYFAVIDDIVGDTKTSYEKIAEVADVYGLQKVTQENLRYVKEHMLLQLDYMIKHYIGLKNYIRELFEKGINEEYLPEVVNKDYERSEFHADICQSYITETIQSIQSE